MRSPTSVSAKSKSSRPEPPVPPALLIRRGGSSIHGSGVYARIAIPAAHVIVEYCGERITKAESKRREDARIARVRRGHDSCTYIFDLNQRHDLDARSRSQAVLRRTRATPAAADHAYFDPIRAGAGSKHARRSESGQCGGTGGDGTRTSKGDGQ